MAQKACFDSYGQVVQLLNNLRKQGRYVDSYVETLGRTDVYRLVRENRISFDEFEWWAIQQYQSGRDDANSNR